MEAGLIGREAGVGGNDRWLAPALHRRRIFTVAEKKKDLNFALSFLFIVGRGVRHA